MPKSTPGPWRVRSCQTAVLVDTIRNGEAMLIALVADNDTEGDTDTERKMNNARLIAAAPQMLEALEMTYKYCFAHAERTKDKHAIKDLATIRAAIVAAKGEV